MSHATIGLRIFAALLVAAALVGCGRDSALLSPEEIIRDVRLDLLEDELYFMPANREEEGETVFLPLRKWDIIFVGTMKPGVPTGADPVFLSLLIPGRYDHVLAYVGKDGNGFAYAVELNTDTIEIKGLSVTLIGGLRIYCLGKDFGKEPHPSGGYVLRKEYYGLRWAKTFREEDRRHLLAADRTMVERVRGDFLGKYPYQQEFRSAGEYILIDRTLALVDDGLENGAGCTDYWSSLFEQYAGVCLKGSRMTAAEIMDYYRSDPVGKKAYFPSYLNPLGTGDLTVGSVLGMGFRIIDDKPHRFSCDGTEETGLVLPDRMFSSETLMDIPSIGTDQK